MSPSVVSGEKVYTKDISIVSFHGSKETLKRPPLSSRTSESDYKLG